MQLPVLENKIIFEWSAYTQFMNPHRTGYSLRGSVTRQNEPGANCTTIWSGNDNLLLPLELRALKKKKTKQSARKVEERKMVCGHHLHNHYLMEIVLLRASPFDLFVTFAHQQVKLKLNWSTFKCLIDLEWLCDSFLVFALFEIHNNIP